MPREITITLLPQSERLAKEDPFGLSYPPLYHQIRTVEALERSDLVINTYNTGTGKTRAALLHLLKMPVQPNHNVLIIAPTNELVRQHQADTVEFIQNQKLDWYALPPVDAENLRAFRDKEREETDDSARNARVLDKMIRNPQNYVDNATTQKPFVMVTNPDIFYYSLYQCYRGGELDSRNLFHDFVGRFQYIVIDEFHYYNPKQFSNFLFFFSLCRRFGYFDGTRRICLLSATPSNEIRAYLTRLAELPETPTQGIQFRWEEIRPDNEPPEAAELELTPALAPLQLTLVGDPFALQSRVEADLPAIKERLATGEEGVVLSGSLATIADVQATLRQNHIAEDVMGVITGPAKRAERDTAKNKALILATPTVDIGYNFGRPDKLRQSVDFLYLDARNAAELLQRIGRAGRVLGKSTTDISSQAVACVAGNLVEAVIQSGKTDWDRADFAALTRETLPGGSWPEAYLNSWALLESYLPLYELGQTIPEDLKTVLDALFADIRAVFSPGSDVTPERLTAKIRAYNDRKQLLESVRKGSRDAYTERLWSRAASGYVRRRFWEEGKDFNAQPVEKQRDCLRILLSKAGRAKVLEYAEAGYERMRSLLTFRGGDLDLTCGVYDPNRLLPSGSEVCAYSLLHLLQNYDVRLLNRKQFLEAAQTTVDWCDCYAILNERAKKRHKVQLGLSAERSDRETFKKKFCGYPVALRGFRLEGELPDGAGNLLEDRYLTALITTWREPRALVNAIAWPELRVWPLRVVLDDGDEMFSVVLGATAFMVHAELRHLWQLRQPGIEESKAEPQDEEQSLVEGE